MTAIGETLRRERIRRNLDLSTISQELKISVRHLEAIEAEEFNKLPAGVFAKSFVRQYARVLGLDDEEMAASVQLILEPPPEPAAERAAPVKPAVHIRVPPMSSWQSVGDGRRFNWSSLSALGGVVAVILVCSGVYAFWQKLRSTPEEQDRAPIARTAPPAPSPSAITPGAVAQQPVQTASNDPVPPASAPGPQPQQTITGSADRHADGAAVLPAPNTSPAAPAAPAGAFAVQLKAEEPVWVRARVNGKYLFSGTLEPNQVRTVDADGTVELLLGNAGGITISVNGKPIGDVGPRGQVRTVQLSSGGFKILSPTPAAFFDPL